MEAPWVSWHHLFETRRFDRITNDGESATWLPDSRRLLYATGQQLWIVDSATPAVRPITGVTTSTVHNILLSSDGRSVFISQGHQQGDVWVVDLKP